MTTSNNAITMPMSNAQIALIEARKAMTGYTRPGGRFPADAIVETAKKFHKLLKELDKDDE